MCHLYLPGNIAPLIAMIIFAIYLFLTSIVMRTGSYFDVTDPKYIFNLFLILAIIVYSSLAIQTPTDRYNNRMFPWLNIFSWLRGGAYLRNFKPTRIFVAIFI
jgi:hypothetical protein